MDFVTVDILRDSSLFNYAMSLVVSIGLKKPIFTVQTVLRLFALPSVDSFEVHQSIFLICSLLGSFGWRVTGMGSHFTVGY